MASTPPPDISVSKDENFTISNKNISIKTAYYKFGTNATTDDTVMEIITKDSKDIAVNDQIAMNEGNSYVVKQIDKTPVKFASGTPLVSKSMNIRFPRPEAKAYAPEKIATFLIFKK
jgi:hypothetical protein